MKYITMPKLTEEDHMFFIEQFQGFSMPAYRKLVEWLQKGTSRAATRKGNAQDLMTKFIGTSANYLERVHNNGGTLVASNGVMAAVILPDNADEWDFRDAYILKEDGERWTAVQDSFKDCTAHPHSTVGVEALQELLSACKGRRDEYRGMPRKTRGQYPLIDINAETMEAISHRQAADMFAASSGKPMCFDASYLETVLKFILCNGADAEVFYSRHLSPIYLRSKNLYAVLLPLRASWARGVGGKNCV
jgi:hypothetical protein